MSVDCDLRLGVCRVILSSAFGSRCSAASAICGQGCKERNALEPLQAINPSRSSDRERICPSRQFAWGYVQNAPPAFSFGGHGARLVPSVPRGPCMGHGTECRTEGNFIRVISYESLGRWVMAQHRANIYNTLSSCPPQEYATPRQARASACNGSHVASVPTPP